MYVYRRRINSFIVFSFVSLKRYCAYILEVLNCVLIVAIDAFVNIEACSFVVIDWSRRAGSSSSSRVPDSPRPDSSQDFDIEKSIRVKMLISSIRVGSRCWYRVLIWSIDPTRQDIKYFYK